MNKVIVLGSLNMDLSIQCDVMPKQGETIHGYDFVMNPGGKGGNQAVAASKQGVETLMIANVGKDMFGKEIRKKLQDNHVTVDYIAQSQTKPTGIAMITCMDHDNRIILDSGANATLTFEQVKERLDQIARPNDIFLTQLENDYDVVCQSIHYAKQLGLRTILNPAPARTLEVTLYHDLDIIVVNQSECELLTGIYPVDESTCKQAFDYFAKNKCKAIITLGSKGSMTNLEKQLLFVESQNVEPVDTTGAGDSYIGAFCACLVKQMPIQEALEYATKAAAITVTRRGAQQSIPYAYEVKERFL